MANWLDLSSTSNMLKAAYVKGFVDISGGDFIARTGNLYIQGTSSLVGAVTICGELRAVYPAGSIPSNAIVGGAGISSSSDVALTQRLQVSGDVSLNSKLYVAGAAVFAGIPTAPTATAGTNTTQIATTAFVKSAVDGLVSSAPAALDTLNELATALGNDASFSTTVTNSLAAKAPLANPALTGVPTAPTATVGTNTTQLATTAFVTSAVALKPSFSQVDVSLALKPSFAQVDASLNLKPSFAQVDASLNLKPSFSQVDASLNLKPSFSQVDASLNLKSNLTYVDSSLNLKSNLTYVDSSLNLKSNVTYVDASLNLKSNLTYVDSSLNLKANLVSPTFTGPLVVASGDVSMNNNLSLGGNLVINGNLTVFRQENASIINTTTSNYEIVITKDISLNGNLVVANNASLNSKLYVVNDASLNSKLYVVNDALLNSKLVVANNVSLNSKLAVSNDASFNMRVDICGNLYAQYPAASIPISAVNGASTIFSQIDASLNLKSDITYVDASLNLKANLASPTFTGTVGGITKSMVGLGNADNTSDSNKPVSTAAQTALDLKANLSSVDASLNLKANLASPTFTGTVSGITKSMVGLGNADNTSDANKPISTATQSALDLKANLSSVDASLNLKADLASPNLTGTPSAPTAAASTNSTQIATTEFVKTAVANLVASAPATLDTLNELALALGSDASFSTTVSNAIGLKAPIDNPTFTGTVGGITKSMVGLGNADNTSDANKPVSTAAQSALDLKANLSSVDASLNLKADLASPTFTGTVGGITKSMVGLGNSDNTSDANKPVSTATQSALDLKASIINVDASLNLKANLANPTFTGTVGGITKSMVGLGNADNTSDANKPISTATQTALNLKANLSSVDASLNLKADLASPALTGTPSAPTAAASTNSTQIATTEFVKTAVANLVASAPATLDTLNELALALGSDASFSTTVSNAIGLKAPIANPTFTGTVGGITKSMVGLGNSDDTSDANKPISTATQSALDLKANISTVDVSLNLKANLANPTFTGTVGGITKSMVGLGNADNTSDANKPISTSTQTALNLKADLASPTFTGTVGGITKSMVGLGNADNTTDANKPISTATQSALELKASISAVDASFSTYKSTVDASFGLKANALNAALTGVPTAPTAGAGANSTQLANTEFVTGAISTYKTTVDNSFSSVDTIKANKASPTFTGIVTAPKLTSGDASFNGRVDISGVLSVTQTVNSVVTNTTINNYNVSVTNDLSLNGKLLVSGDVSFNSKLFISNTITISGDIIPQTANQSNLGSAEKPFKSLFVSNNTINLIGTDTTTGNPTTTGISVDNGKMKITNPSGPEQQVVVTLDNRTGFGMDSSYAIATIDVSGTAIIRGDVSFNSKLYVSGNALLNGRVDICGNLYAQYPINSISTTAIIDGVTLSYVDASLGLKAPLNNPTFTGSVGGITKSMVGLGSVDNTTDASKPISTATQSALDLKAAISYVDSSLNLKANLASPTFTGTVGGITKSMVGLGSVDNTTDASKPISTATQSALDLKAALASPTFTGTPTAPTASYDNSSNQLATTGFVQSRISSIINSAPAALDTLNELAAALGNDANYAATITTALSLKAPLENPTFTGTVGGITKSMVGLANVDNTSDANKPISTATQSALDLKSSITYVDASLNLKATLASPTFTGTVGGITKSMVGLGSVDNTTDANKPISTATQSALDLKASIGVVDASLNLKANLASPTFTGTVGGITKSMVGLANVDNTTDASKPISTATQSALDLKANLASPTFTGTVGGITKSMVGLANVDNTTDANKPISTATQSALDLKATISVVDTSLNLKANLASPTFTGTVGGITQSMVGLGNVDNTSDANKPVSTATQSALDLKAALASPTFTGTPNAPTALYDNSSNQLATTGFVQGRISSIINSAPAALDTLNELAAALGNDANYAATITTSLSLKAPLANPTFTGTVIGITKSMVDLANADNTSDANKPISTATQTALDLKSSITYVDASLNLKATLASPTFTGTVGGITKSMVGLANADNTSDANKPISTATQSALDLKVSSSVVDTSLNLKANLASPMFTGTIYGITQSMVGLANVDNTSDANKPISTATQSALDLKASITYVDASLNLKPRFSQVDASLNLKANLASPDLTGAPTAPTASSNTNTTQIATTEFVTSAFNNLKANDVSLNGKLSVANDVSLNKNVDISGNLVIRGNLSVFQQQSTSIINTSVNNYAVISTQDISLNGNLVVSADVSLNSKLYVNNDVLFNSKLIVANDTSFNGRVDVSGTFYAAQYKSSSIPSSALNLTSDITVNSLRVGRGSGNDQYSTALGSAALYYNTSGYCNTAIGYYSSLNNTSGYFNNSLGYLALRNNTTGYNNTAMGCFALQNNTTADENTAFGYTAGINNSTGSFNTFLGSNTNISPTNATWASSTAIGANALITASNQITLGVAATTVRVPGKLSVIGDASFNGRVDICGNFYAQYPAESIPSSAIIGGVGSGGGVGGSSATDISVNTLTVGRGPGDVATNSAFGYQALLANTTGANNTAIGYQAGDANTTGSNNTYLGAYADATGATFSSSTAIGANARITASNQIVLGTSMETINVPGKLSINSDSSFNGNIDISGVLSVTSTISTSVKNTTINNYNVAVTNDISLNGNLKASGQITAASFNATSDYRIKSNILPLSDCYFGIDALNPVSYHNKITDREDIGFIAHELQPHFPFLVTGEKDGDAIQTVNYTGIIGLLVHELQQLKKNVIPQTDLIYRGSAQLTNGGVQINLDNRFNMPDGTFAAFKDIAVFTSNETGWDQVRGSISGNSLTIECMSNTSNAQVSYLVAAKPK